MQFDDPEYGGTHIAFDKGDFVTEVERAHRGGQALVDGYAPFCKHVFVPNFVGAVVGDMEIDASSKKLLKTGYKARTEEELAVLCRWFDRTDVAPREAKWLDVILYSREQIAKEAQAMGRPGGDQLPDAPWGIISVKAQDVDRELPMQPITMMRNALGKEEGGSGVPLDRAQYQASVAYWANRAIIEG